MSTCKKHGQHDAILCPQCMMEYKPSSTLVEETHRFHEACASISAYFESILIPDKVLDEIVQDCLSRNDVLHYLSIYPKDSLEYYLLRARIVIVIKNHIAAYIDGKLAPKD